MAGFFLGLVAEEVVAEVVFFVVLDLLDQQLLEPGLRVEHVDFTQALYLHQHEREVHSVVTGHS